MRVYMKELRFTADEDDDLIREWRMDIPKSFVYQHRGVNGKPNYDPIKDKSNQFSVVLFAAIDPENNRVVEQEKIGWPTPGERQVFLRIENVLSSKKLRGVERCLTDRDKAKISRGGGFVCRAKLCRVTMFVDGWRVRMSLDRELYEKDLQKHCDITREFLDQMTLNRESLIVGESGGD